MEYPGWDALLLAHRDHSIFHTVGWAKVLSDSYGFTPHYFLELEDGKITLALPVMEVKNFGAGKRGVSLPFSDYCDPLLAENVSLQNVLEKAIAYGKKRGWTSLEIRKIQDVATNNIPHGDYLHHELEISGEENTLFSNFRDSTCRNVQKGTREGVRAILQDSEEAMDRYYSLHCITRKSHGLPPQPLSFFRNVQKHILAKGNGFVALALFRGKCIAGGIYMNFGEKAIFKYGASDARYQEFRGNNVVMWEAIRFFSRNGFKSLSFGRTDPENNGLETYKRGWGGVKSKLAYIKYDVKNGRYITAKKPTYGVHNRIFRHLPIGVCKFLGRSIYPFMD